MKMSSYRPHERVLAPLSGESMTRQEFQEECDINAIMRRFEKTGVVQHFNRAQPMYLDLSEAPADLQGAMNIMIEAERAFMSLPASVRKRFGNDATEFVKFASEPDNVEQMRSWGLAEPVVAPAAPMRVEVVNSTGEPPKGAEGGSTQ